MSVVSDVSIECFEKSRRRQSLFPLHSLENFEVLYTDDGRGRQTSHLSPGGATPHTRSMTPRSRSPSPTGHSRSMSPNKDTTMAVLGTNGTNKSAPLTMAEHFQISSRTYGVTVPQRRQTLTPRSPSFGGRLSGSQLKMNPERVNSPGFTASSYESVKLKFSHANSRQKRLITLSRENSRREQVRSARSSGQGQGCVLERETGYGKDVKMAATKLETATAQPKTVTQMEKAEVQPKPATTQDENVASQMENLPTQQQIIVPQIETKAIKGKPMIKQQETDSKVVKLNVHFS